MMKVGITGGIGSGKSTVCKVFEHLGIPVYFADIRARELIASQRGLQESITAIFGTEAFTDGEYNRSYIAESVFRDRSLLTQLNDIVHPAVAADFLQWTGKYPRAAYVLLEAAILFESGTHKMMDHTIFINAPEPLRIKRVMKRDGVPRREVTDRIKNQLPADKIRPLADWVIINDDKSLILPQILNIHHHLIKTDNTHA